MLALENICLNFGGIAALGGISLHIPDGTICSVLGPSGCGKTSILNILAGNITHHTGSAHLHGQAIDRRRSTIGFISQDYGLLPWRTAYKNITLPLVIRGIKPWLRREKIERTMENLHIAHLQKRYPAFLSGGQKQRVAIAAAFVMDLDLLLMDEPFSALDQITREQVQEMFFDVWAQSKPTTVFVTHSIEEAVFMGQMVVILSDAPGRVLEIVPNPTFGQPDVRISDEYMQLCKSIREKIKHHRVQHTAMP